MSLTNPLPRGARQMPDYVSDGVNLIYPYNFWIANAADLAVFTQAPGNVAFGALANGVNFSVTGAGSPGGGAAVLAAPLLSGTLVRVMGLRIPNRTTSVVNGGALVSAALEAELDVETATMQELRRDVTAALALLATQAAANAAANFPVLGFTGWLQSLPTAPQIVPGWWNNAGAPVFS